MDEIQNEVAGAADLFRWFGYWPSFHDAEVVSIELNRTGGSFVSVHTFERTKELTASGHFVCAKHVIVRFRLQEIEILHLDDFNHQNVLWDLELHKVEKGFELLLNECYGLRGTIVAKRISIALEPGIPEASVYAEARVI